MYKIISFGSIPLLGFISTTARANRHTQRVYTGKSIAQKNYIYKKKIKKYRKNCTKFPQTQHNWISLRKMPYVVEKASSLCPIITTAQPRERYFFILFFFIYIFHIFIFSFLFCFFCVLLLLFGSVFLCRIAAVEY